jgi:cytochrome c-type protein NapC
MSAGTLGRSCPLQNRREGNVVNLPSPLALLYVLLLISAAMIALIVLRPSITASREGKMLAFVAFLILPVLCMAGGASEHLDRSKRTQFCLSCHVMESHGKSLYVDDPSYLAAAHFQNHLVPVDEACYTCHTDYALYGGVRAKLRGLKHIYIQYLGTPPKPENIKLYSPYNNRECLHCHQGARSFQGNEIHVAMLDSLLSNETSCMTSGCHDTVHNVGNLNTVKFWSPAP